MNKSRREYSLKGLKKLGLMKEAAPEEYAAFVAWSDEVKRTRGRPKTAQPKKRTTIYLSQSVIEKFKATGEGWQTRINEVLEKAEV